MRLVNKFLRSGLILYLNPTALNPYYPKSNLSTVALLDEMTKRGELYYDYRRLVSDSIIKARDWQINRLKLKPRLQNMYNQILGNNLQLIRKNRQPLDTININHGPEIYDPNLE